MCSLAILASMVAAAPEFAATRGKEPPEPIPKEVFAGYRMIGDAVRRGRKCNRKRPLNDHAE